MVERDSGVSFNVDFYSDQDSTAHTTEIVTCDSDADIEDKIWKRVYCGAVGAFHKIKVYHTASSQTVRIYAIMPWFKASGPIRG